MTKARVALQTHLLGLILLFPASVALAAGPVPGHYYSKAHNGHGFDFQQVGDAWVVVLYTYDGDGEPLWYFSVAKAAADGRIGGDLALFTYDSSRFPAQQLDHTAGRFSLDFSVKCSETQTEYSASFSWTLNDESATWCVEPILDKTRSFQPDLTGQWFGGVADQGWGVSVDFAGDETADTEVQVLFYYDSAGFPRWAFGVADQAGPVSTTTMYNYRGYCRLCEPVPLQGEVAGTISHAIGIDRGRVAGTVDIDVDYKFGPGGAWQRAQAPYLQLSDPQKGLIPFPDQLAADVPLAITDTSVVPLTEEGLVLEHQTVLLRGGVIEVLGTRGSVPVPEDAWIVDGRGLFVGPGLADMHTHIAFLTPTAMRESGLLMIANGVTTNLNMGDGGSFDLVGLAQDYRTGAAIGPRLYLGKTAYGPTDRGGTNVTLTSAAGASAYVEKAARDGYQFIKVYNGITRSMMRELQTHAARLGLPVIGHLPKRISMEESLQLGQVMMAHIQEPYQTYLGNQRSTALLEQATNIMRGYGVFMTDTLPVFESFAGSWGGNRANYEQYITREGVEYISKDFLGTWENVYQGWNTSSSAPGQLDAMYGFYLQMTKYFADAGIPLLLGTDAPGFPGVHSGFSSYTGLLLYEEAGLTPYQAYMAGAANPGRFIRQTLNEAVAFGTVEAGMRADLLVMTANPLDSIRNLKRPFAVIAGGRLWSQAFLQTELDKLKAKYHPELVQ